MILRPHALCPPLKRAKNYATECNYTPELLIYAETPQDIVISELHKPENLDKLAFIKSCSVPMAAIPISGLIGGNN